MQKNAFKWYSIISGSVFLLLLLGIAVLIPCPTSAQFLIFRIMISVAAGAFAAVIPGTFTLKHNIVQATSGIGVFALIYFLNPAGWVTKDDCRGVQNFKGIIFIDNKEQKDVEIIVPSIGRSAFTDGFGNFNIEYAESLISYPLTIRVRYKTLLDTSFTIQEIPSDRTELRFSINNKVSSTLSISGNSASFSNKDFNVIVSVRNTDFKDKDLFLDSVVYRPSARADTLFITPYMKYLENLRLGKVMKAGGIASEISMFASPLPQLDIKVVNNSSEAVFMTEAVLEVQKSMKDNRALLVMADGHTQVYICNAGWGSARDVTIDFSVVPLTSSNKWTDHFEDHVSFGDIGTQAEGDGNSANTTLELKNVLLRKGVKNEYFVENYFTDLLSQHPDDSSAVHKHLGGPFYKGGYVYGIIKYTDEDGTSRSVRFEATIDLFAEAGAAIDASSEYNTEFQAEGDSYRLSVPLSQGIKSKDFDRFFISMHAPQSSFHVFTLKFIYNNNDVFEIPNIFSLQYFNTPEGIKYVTKVSKIRRQ